MMKNTTVDILIELAERLGITHFRLVKFGGWKYLQDYLSPSETNTLLLDRIKDFSESTGISFWDSALIDAMRTDGEVNREVLGFADHHNFFEEEKWVSADYIREEAMELDANWGINSLVKIKDFTAHIPMLDFHIPVSHKGAKIVTMVGGLLTSGPGYILNSGKSYHYISKTLLTENGLMDFLGRAILYGPITDVRWIAHQIIERSCTLRIGKKNGVKPTIV